MAKEMWIIMKVTRTWNQQEVKKENKFLVMQKLIDSSPISRAEIANTTGLNKGTVSSLVNELLEDELIYESGEGQSSGGRRPVMLIFNQIAGYSIGIDIGVNYLLGLLTDLQGNICHEKKVRFSDLTYEQIKMKVFEVIDFLKAVAPPSPYGVIGIGIGVPGTVNNSGEILLAPNLGWKNAHLKEVIQERYQVPVIIENEANAGAYGEKHFGTGTNSNNIVYISIGIGIGVGLILNGNLYKGSNGFSGELGHMTIEANGIQCRCGSEGCWERYASEKSLLKSAQQLGVKPGADKELSLEHLLLLAENGDKEVIKLFEEIGDYLGIGVKNIINIFNPEQVIIGNRISLAEKWLKGPLDNRINQTIWFNQENTKINFLKQATHSTALGVAAFSIESFLEKDLKIKSSIS